MGNVYDVVILGSGPGGLSAAIYSARYARKTLVVSKSFGGVAAKAGYIENWPGTKKILGIELVNNFVEHAKEYGVEFMEKEVKSISKKGKSFEVDLEDEKVKGKTIILSMGMKNRKLNIPGERELIGKGVSYCATCDGMFFRGKDVVVIGGGDSAAKATLFLSEVAKSVKLIYRGEKLKSEPTYQKRIFKKENIEVIYNSVPLGIFGENKVESIKIKDKKEKVSELKCDGVFVEIGAEPISSIPQLLGVDLDEKGFTKVGRDMKTNVLGVFAIGDMTNTPLRQIITSSADGAIAAHGAHEYLQDNFD